MQPVYFIRYTYRQAGVTGNLAPPKIWPGGTIFWGGQISWDTGAIAKVLAVLKERQVGVEDVLVKEITWTAQQSVGVVR